MNDYIRYTPSPSFEPFISPEPLPSVSPQASPATAEIVKLTPEPTPYIVSAIERSLNPPSVSDANLRRFAAILDEQIAPTKIRDYIIYAEYGNYVDVSLYLMDEGSTLNADGTVFGSYTRYRVFSSYDSDARFQVYTGQTSKLVFPRLGDTRSANVYSNILGYCPNPYYAELHHARSSSVFDTLSFLVITFSSLFALMIGVIGKCLRK